MKRKIAAIFAADVAGYSRLVAEDEEETLRRLQAYREVIDDFIAKSSGRIFNTAGDAVLAEFSSAVEAVRCAIDIQESLRTRNRAYPPSRQMNFRIGITIGDVVERDGDLLGDGVNIAARLEGIAPSRRHLRFAHRVRAGRQQALGAVFRHRRAAGQEYPQSGARLHGGDVRRGRKADCAAAKTSGRAGIDFSDRDDACRRPGDAGRRRRVFCVRETAAVFPDSGSSARGSGRRICISTGDPAPHLRQPKPGNPKSSSPKQSPSSRTAPGSTSATNISRLPTTRRLPSAPDGSAF